MAIAGVQQPLMVCIFTLAHQNGYMRYSKLMMATITLRILQNPVTCREKLKHVGHFASAQQAAVARDRAVIAAGRSRLLNFAAGGGHGNGQVQVSCILLWHGALLHTQVSELY